MEIYICVSVVSMCACDFTYKGIYLCWGQTATPGTGIFLSLSLHNNFSKIVSKWTWRSLFVLGRVPRRSACLYFPIIVIIGTQLNKLFLLCSVSDLRPSALGHLSIPKSILVDNYGYATIQVRNRDIASISMEMMT